MVLPNGVFGLHMAFLHTLKRPVRAPESRTRSGIALYTYDKDKPKESPLAHLEEDDNPTTIGQDRRTELDFPAIPGLTEGTPLANPFEQVMAHLVSLMRSGALPYGTRLPSERDLSEHFEVSRVTLRAVIRTLQQSGYLKTVRGRSGGSTVVWQHDTAQTAPPAPRLSPAMKERLLDSLVFRSILEPGAAELAAARPLDDTQRATLQAHLAAVRAAGMNARIPDAELHGYIGELSGCKALAESIENLQLLLNEQLMKVLPEIGPAMDHSNEQHERVVAAILDGDPATARQIMHDHVEATRELILGFLQ